MNLSRLAILAGVLGMCLVGCTGNPRPVSSFDSGLPGGALPRGRPTIVMDTLNVMGDATEGSFETEGAGYSSQSAAELGVRLAGAGVMVVDTTKWDQTQRENVRHIMAQLGENHRVLLSAFRDKSAIVPALNQLQNNSGAELLCVSQLQDKEGLGGMYDPNSGTIHETTSSFDLKVILISLADGRIVWGNEVYVRQALTSKNRAQCEGVLFGTISK